MAFSFSFRNWVRLGEGGLGILSLSGFAHVGAKRRRKLAWKVKIFSEGARVIGG